MSENNTTIDQVEFLVYLIALLRYLEMKKFFKYVLILLAFDVLLFLLLALKPAPDALTKSDCIQVSGVVSTVSGGEVGNLVVSLVQDDRKYYIEQLLSNEDDSLEEWEARLKGKSVTLYYPNYWTPLDYAGKLRHLSLLEVEGEEVWGELAGVRERKVTYGMKEGENVD